jgi:hypothetical protein
MIGYGLIAVMATVEGEQVLERVFLEHEAVRANRYAAGRRSLDPESMAEAIPMTAYPRVATTISAASSAAFA